MERNNLKVTVEMSVSEAASAMARSRWSKATDEDRAKQADVMKKVQRKVSKAKRREFAHKAATSITPEAASERARKAWKTKRRKSAERKNSAA